MVLVLISGGAIYFMLRFNWQNLWYSNPPNGWLMIYSCGVFTLLFSLYKILNQLSVCKYFLRIMEIIGENSLYIYLLHMLVIDLVTGFFDKNGLGLFDSLSLRKIVLYACGMFAPIAIKEGVVLLRGYVWKKIV